MYWSKVFTFTVITYNGGFNSLQNSSVSEGEYSTANTLLALSGALLSAEHLYAPRGKEDRKREGDKYEERRER